MVDAPMLKLPPEQQVILDRFIEACQHGIPYPEAHERVMVKRLEALRNP